LKDVNALIQTHPNSSWLYMVKYQVLAGKDGAQADALLTSLLKTDPPGFDWDHLVAYSYTAAKHPNYDLALATADHAISRAETKLVAVLLLERKIDIYLSRSRSRARPEDAAADKAKAAETLTQAINLMRSPGVPRDARLEKDLQEYGPKVKAQVCA